jgi:Sensors of blue-light using FAD
VLQHDLRDVAATHGNIVAEDHVLRSLAYRSVAVSPPTDSELHDLLRAAQQRNKAEGVTGVLLVDQGVFFQWLEGPSAAVGRVWDSISRDPRHTRVSVLHDEPISRRVFDGWDMRIARGARVKVEAAVAAVRSSSTQLLKHLIGRPTSLLSMPLEAVFETSVIPRLLEVHAHSLRAAAPRESTRAIWHAHVNSGATLARVLLAPRLGETSRYVDSLLEQGAGFNALYHEVFEPAQRQLGLLWDAHQCDDFHLTIGLARLQSEVRRVNAAVPGDHACQPGHSVLLCPQPAESDGVGLLMSSEVFDRSGWDVTCRFPRNDGALLDVVGDRWFDVLKLSQSGSLRRDSRLLSLRDTIDAARRASLNPALIVMVDGRTFAEKPQVHRAVHAHAVSLSVLDAVSIAGRLLSASRNLTASAQVTAS